MDDPASDVPPPAAVPDPAAGRAAPAQAGRARRGRAAAAAAAALLTLAAVTLPAEGEAAEAVDLELVLAVDVSFSMDTDEQQMQRLGYIHAITAPEVMAAIRSGLTGRIALTYVEWAGVGQQQVVVDWQMVDGPEAADAFAAALAAAPLRRVFRTSISGAIAFATDHFHDNGFEGARRVIDVSGDGPNNQGPMVTAARDRAVAAGITINGLPLMLKRSVNTYFDIADLDAYYAACVIGGEGAFSLPVREMEAFGEAVRRKLVLEIAGAAPPWPTPIGFGAAAGGAAHPRVWPAADVGPEDSLCTIGERIWRQRMGDN